MGEKREFLNRAGLQRCFVVRAPPGKLVRPRQKAAVHEGINHESNETVRLNDILKKQFITKLLVLALVLSMVSATILATNASPAAGAVTPRLSNRIKAATTTCTRTPLSG